MNEVKVRQPKFNEGEIVRVTGACYGHRIPIGRHVRIQKSRDNDDRLIDGCDYDYVVEELIPSGGRTFMLSQLISEDCMEKDMSKDQKFNKGEIVKIVGNSYDHAFPIGSYVKLLDRWEDTQDQDNFLAQEITSHSDPIDQILAQEDFVKADFLVDRLKIRAMIRRQAQDRKSVQEGKRDRLADLLDEAANYISILESDNAVLVENSWLTKVS